MDVEKNPTVKFLTYEWRIPFGEIKLRIKTKGYPAYKEKIADHVYTLDFKKLGFEEEPYVISPYTNKNLPFVISWRCRNLCRLPKIYMKLCKNTEHGYKPGDDIRDSIMAGFACLFLLIPCPIQLKKRLVNQSF